MNRKMTVSLVAWACFGFVGAIFGQESGGPWRLRYQDRTSTSPVETYFETRQQAEAWQQSLVQDNTTARGLGLPVNYFDFRIEQTSAADLKDEITDRGTAISYTGEAMKALRDKLHLKLVKRGDVLREYGQLVRGSLRNANQLRSKLMSMNGSIERQTFDQINAKIDEFNKQAEDYNKLLTSPETVSKLQQENGGRIVGPQEFPKIETVSSVQSSQLKGTLTSGVSSQRSNGLAGKKGVGRFGTTPLRVEFRETGKAVFYDSNSPTVALTRGTWEQSGNNVSIETESFRYSGVINGDSMSGTRTGRSPDDRTSESWKVTLGADANRDDSTRESRPLTAFSSPTPGSIQAAERARQQQLAAAAAQRHQHHSRPNYGYSDSSSTGGHNNGGLDWNTFNAFQMQSNMLMNGGGGYHGGGNFSSQPHSSPHFGLPGASSLYVPGSGGYSGNSGTIRMDEHRPYSR